MKNLPLVLLFFCFISCTTTSHSSVNKTKTTQIKPQPTYTETDYDGQDAEVDDLKIAEEIVFQVFGKAQLSVLSRGVNIAVVVDENGVESSIGIYILLERNAKPPLLGDSIAEYVLPKSVKFTTTKRYFYYNQARKADFDEVDVRLRLLDKVPTADFSIVERNSSSASKVLIDIVKDSPHIQIHRVEE